MKSKISLTRAELESHLDEQIAFLEASAASYDAGFHGEAKRLAVTIRVLVHDTKHSLSLLGQLDKKALKYFDTAFDYDPSSNMSHGGLVFIEASQGETRYVAMLDDLPRDIVKIVDFEEWWNKPVFVDQQRRQLSRRDLILTSANQDGGAHVDKELDAIYARLSRGESMGWYDSMGQPLSSPERAAIRQIAHEMLKVLKPGYTKMPRPSKGFTLGGMRFIRGDGDIKMKSPFTKRKIGRNDPCPCGSGKKYKRCHGR